MNRRALIATLAATSAAALLGTYYWKNRWRYIVVHHSAGNFGNVDFLRKVHDERQANDPIKAIPYHYVIGNGNGMGMGEVGSDWRAESGLWGAHLSRHNVYKNFCGLGICLIGNYDVQQVPAKQYDPLLQLTKLLMKQHAISASHVLTHGHTEGEQTACPGKNFPLAKFIKDISRS